MSAHAHHSGVPHWKWQRISSLLLIPYTAWLLWAAMTLAGADHAQASAFFSSPLQGFLAVSMTALAAYHAQTGIQVICEDYLPKSLQGVLIALTRLGCIGGTLLVAWAMWLSSQGGA